jgi:hypothetical protein
MKQGRGGQYASGGIMQCIDTLTDEQQLKFCILDIVTQCPIQLFGQAFIRRQLPQVLWRRALFAPNNGMRLGRFDACRAAELSSSAQRKLNEKANKDGGVVFGPTIEAAAPK